MRFSKKEILSAEKRINAWIKKGTGLPGYVTLVEMDSGKKVKLFKREYAGLWESVNMFRLNNGRTPNYCTLNNLANNCLVWDRQNNAYNCCPTSLSMASQLLYNYKSEQECSKALGTTKNGTAPQQLIDNASKLGFKIVPIERKAKAVRDSLRLGFPVIVHFQTGQTKACKGDYIGSFGHYALCWDVTDSEYVLADPSKSVNRKYKFLCLDRANQGYRQNYYSVR